MIETDRRTVLEFLETRRSPRLRSLGDPCPSDAEVERMLTVASRVPDHGRLVPWRFILIRGDRRAALCERIGACYPEDHPDASDELVAAACIRLTHAPLVVAVVFRPRTHPKVPEWEQILSVGAVCMNLLNAARALGYAGLWLTEWYAFDRRVLGELGVAPKERLAGFIHVGTETAPREERPRPALAELVTEY